VRIAIVCDIHGNRTAFEAVLADLRETAPDLILHGGDLVHGGSDSAAIVDRIRDLGWPGVLGNTDEMLFRPQALHDFASQSSAPASLWEAVEEMAAVDRDRLGADRLAWLSILPLRHTEDDVALVHASPESAWRSPSPEATDAELDAVYRPLSRPVAVYGHVHRSFVRNLPGLVVVNAGSVSLSFDGDPRASYLLLDGQKPVIRRVAYDVEKEIAAVEAARLPHAEMIARTLRKARPQMP